MSSGFPVYRKVDSPVTSTAVMVIGFGCLVVSVDGLFCRFHPMARSGHPKAHAAPSILIGSA